MRQSHLHPDLTGPLSSAHAQFDPITGDVFNYNLSLGAEAAYRIFCTSAATGKTTILATISDGLTQAAYVHSFFITTDYIIFCVWPAIFGAGGMRILQERNMIDAMDFHPDVSARWFVVDRSPSGRGVVATFLSDAFFSYHTINAWQEPAEDGSSEEEDLICDIVTYPDMGTLSKIYYENLVSSSPAIGEYKKSPEAACRPSLVRYRLRGIPKTGTVAKEEDTKLPRVEIETSYKGTMAGDLPTINPRFATKKSRYIYNVIDRGLVWFSSLSSSFSPHPL